MCTQRGACVLVWLPHQRGAAGVRLLSGGELVRSTRSTWSSGQQIENGKLLPLVLAIEICVCMYVCDRIAQVTIDGPVFEVIDNLECSRKTFFPICCALL